MFQLLLDIQLLLYLDGCLRDIFIGILIVFVRLVTSGQVNLLIAEWKNIGYYELSLALEIYTFEDGR